MSIAAMVAALLSLATAMSPAGAVPAVVRVSGDDASRNLIDPTNGPWTFDSNYFDGLKTAFDGQSIGEATFQWVAPVAEVTDETLANVDVYIASAVGGTPGGPPEQTGYTATEEAAFLRFVQRGGVLIANSNSPESNLTRFLGATITAPPSWHDVAEDATTTVPPSAAVGSNPLNNGVGSIQNYWHFTHFTALPPEAIALFQFQNNCDPVSPDCAVGGTTFPAPFSNDVESARPVAAYIPFGTPAFGAGGVVMTTDSDTFAGGAGDVGHLLTGGNLAFATNTFQWIADHFTEESPTKRFVDAAYVTLLGRPADGAGLGYWSDLLDSSMITRGDFAFGLANSNEWRTKVISDFYAEYLNRAVDAEGLAYWNGLLAGGMRVSDMAKNIFASDEYFASNGNAVQPWVESLYTAILQRSGEPDGIAYWVGQLNAGAPRAAAANAIFLSFESNVRRVDSLYSDILNRAADPGGRTYWGQQLETMDDIVLAAMLVSSDEFYNRVQAGELPVT